MPSLCLNSLSFTRDETIETTVGHYAMPIKKKRIELEADKSKSSRYFVVFNGTYVNVVGLLSAAISFDSIKSFT